MKNINLLDRSLVLLRTTSLEIMKINLRVKESGMRLQTNSADMEALKALSQEGRKLTDFLDNLLYTFDELSLLRIETAITEVETVQSRRNADLAQSLRGPHSSGLISTFPPVNYRVNHPRNLR